MILVLTTAGEGHLLFTLGNNQVELVTRFNYSAQCWEMDILNNLGQPLQLGLMLIPGHQLLKPHPATQALLGDFWITENSPGDYLIADNLGTKVQLNWTPPV